MIIFHHAYYQRVGNFGSEAGCLDNPAGLAVDGECNMLVADSKNHRISVFSPKVVVLLGEGVRKFSPFGGCGKKNPFKGFINGDITQLVNPSGQTNQFMDVFSYAFS